MLARFYLTRAGVESTGGVKKQQFLDSAKYFAQRVINNSGRALLSNYNDLFKYPYDNNKESLFELQWVFSGSNVWGTNNSMPEYLAYSPDIAFGGWGGDKGATWWLVSQYEGIAAQTNGTLKGRTLDQRLYATFMLPGAYYPEITKVTDRTKLIFPFTGTDNNFLNVKKYVIGSPIDLAGIATQQHYPNDTYMMRLAEMYLVYVEAAMGNTTLHQMQLQLTISIKCIQERDYLHMLLAVLMAVDRLRLICCFQKDLKSSQWKECRGMIWLVFIIGILQKHSQF
jgi:hypothetical protein